MSESDFERGYVAGFEAGRKSLMQEWHSASNFQTISISDIATGLKDCGTVTSTFTMDNKRSETNDPLP